jgi:hypothetical protein
MKSGFNPAARLSPTAKCPKRIMKQYVDGIAHISPQGRNLPNEGKIEAKAIDRPSRNVRHFIWPSS